MTDRPIPFSAPMVRALLDGRKTQTRRALKFQPAPGISIIRKTIRPLDAAPYHSFERRSMYGNYAGELDITIKRHDRLWVRERWCTTLAFEDLPPSAMTPHNTRVKYLADGFIDHKGKRFDHFHDGRHRAGMHMPRWASRLTLTVTDVRVERLQEISRGDAMEEGCPFPNLASGPNPCNWYAGLWDEINGAGAWAANPWVAAYTFMVQHKNIDEVQS